MRQKDHIRPELTDLQIFRSLPDSDPWADAELPSVFLYLYKKARVPDEWHEAMLSFHKEMEKYVAKLQVASTSMISVCNPTLILPLEILSSSSGADRR